VFGLLPITATVDQEADVYHPHVHIVCIRSEVLIW
jgi:hypothetical protein